MTKTILLLLGLCAAPALAQQPAPKTSEQQARTYITSAFMTGAAPLILSDDVVVQPELRQRLKLPDDANSRTVYQALVNLTRGKLLQVRPAIRDEVLQSQVIAAANRPIFALEAGDTTLVLQYDLERDNIAFVGQPAQIASTSPVTPPTPVQQASEPAPAVTQAPAPETPLAAPAAAPAAPEAAPTAAEAPPAPAASEPAAAPTAAATAPAAAPAAEAAKPEPEAPAKAALQVVEPQVPRTAERAPAATPAVQQMARAPFEQPRPLLKPTAPCEIKPVMSDQDLVNCGATPHYR
ncbi:MAG TPA: hypothetical protein VFJ70_08730 [Burkholderiales bacterium]|nr:hypothetical protein [Burkholderiales bacterium]